MTDIAQLGISIASTDALTASANLDKATASAKGTEAAFASLATTATGSASAQAAATNTVAASTSTAATAADRLTSSLEKQIALFGASSSAVANYNGAMAQMTSAELDHYQAQTAVLGQLQAEAAQLRAFYAEQQASVAAGAAFIASLEQQAATIGMNSAELMTYKAAQLGVSEQAASLIAAINGQAGAMDSAAAAASALGEAEAAAASRISLMVEASQAQLAAVTDSTGAMAAYADSVSLMGQAAGAAEVSTAGLNAATESGIAVQGEATSAVLAYNKSVTDYAIAQRTGTEASSQFAAASNAVTESLARELAAIGATRAEMVAYDGAMKGFSEDVIAAQVALVGMIDAQTANVAAAEAATAALAEEAAATDAVGASMAVTTRELAAMGREAARGDFSRMAGSASILGQNLGILGGLFTPLGLSIAAVTAAIGVSAVAADKAAGSLESYGKSVTDMAAQTGASTDFIQQFGFAISATGGKATDEASALDTLSKKMGDAAQGSKTAQAYFASLGISMSDIKNIGVDGVLDKISDAFSGTADSQTKFTTGTYLLGSSFKDMEPLLDQGSGSLQAFGAQLTALGMPSEDAIAQMQQLGVQSATLHAEWSATVLVAESQLLPTLLNLTKGLSETGMGAQMVTSFFHGVDEVINAVAIAVATVTTGFDQLSTAISTAATAANLLGQGKFTDAKNAIVTGFGQMKSAGQDYEKFLNTMSSPAQAPLPISGTGTLATPALGKNSQGALDLTALKGEVAQVQEQLKLETDAVTAAQKVIADQYKSGQLSIDQYYTQNQALITQNAADQMSAAVQEANLVQKEMQDRSLSAQQRATLANEYQADLQKATTADAAYVAATLENTAKQNEAWAAYGNTVTASIQKQIDAANTQAQSLQDQVTAFGQGKAAVDALAVSRAQDALATDTQNLAQDSLNDMLNNGTSDAMTATEAALTKDIQLQTDLIAALQKRQSAQAQLDQDNAEKKAADQATADWKKAGDSIESSLSTALMNGFESGKGFAQSFADALKSMFKTLVLQPIISPIAGQLASYVTGQQPAAGGLGGIGGLLSSAQGTSSVFGLLDSAFGSFSNLFGGGSSSGGGSSGGASAGSTLNLGSLASNLSSANNLYNLLSGSSNGGIMGLLDTGYDTLTGSTTGLSGAVDSVAGLFGAGSTSSTALIGGAGTFGGVATTGAGIASTVGSGSAAVGGLGGGIGVAGLGGDISAEVGASSASIGATAGVAGGADTIAAAPGALSGAAAGLGIAGAGIAAGALISDNKSIIGSSPYDAVGAGAAIGATIGSIVPVVGTAIGAAVGGIIGGIVNAAFGHSAPQVVSSGVQGDITVAGGLQGEQYQDSVAKGGWFSSDKDSTVNSPLTTSQTQAVSQTITATVQAVTALTGAIGDSGGLQEKLSNFNYAIRNDWSNQANITTSLTDLSNGLVDAVEPLDAYALTGETLVQTAERLTAVFTSTNTLADMLGETMTQAFGAVGLAGDATREALVSAAGGITQFNSETQAYYADFYTTQQQNAENTKQVQEGFANLNVTMPATNAQFVQLVDSLDLTTTAGQATFAGLMALAPAFNQMTSAAQTAADNQQALWNNYFSAIYTPAQQAAMSVKQMTDEFKNMGIVMPTTDAGFQALVENINSSTAAGAALQNQLLGMASSFGAMVTASQQAASAQLTLWNNYFSAIYTPQQQLTTSAAELGTEFAALGLAMPASDAAFETLVNSINTTTEAGQDLQNSLLALAPAFGQLQGTLDTNVQTSLTNLQTAYTAQATAINTNITSITAFITTISTLKTSLSTGSLSTQTPQQIYQQEQATFESTNAAALGTPGESAAAQTAAQAALPQAAQDFLTASQAYNASSTAYAADYNLVQQDLSNQVTTATQALSVQQQELAYAQQQVESLININTTAESISDALTAYFAAQDADQHVAAGTTAAQYAASQSMEASLSSLVAAGDTAPSPTSEGTAWDALHGLNNSSNTAANPEAGFLASSGMVVDANGNYTWTGASASGIAASNAAADAAAGISPTQAAAIAAAVQASSDAAYASIDPSASAVLNPNEVTPISGSHAGGLDSVPYDGYIAKLHKGERVQTSAEASSQKAAAIDWSSMGTAASMMQSMKDMAAQITALNATAQKAATAQMTQAAAIQAQNVELMTTQTRQLSRVRTNTAQTAANAAKKK